MGRPHLILLLLVIPTFPACIQEVPGLGHVAYIQPGDIQLGGIFRVHEYSKRSICSDSVKSQKFFQYMEGMVYGVNYVNHQSGLLPNITLGFVILDDCSKDQVALAQAASMLPTEPSCGVAQGGPEGTMDSYKVTGVISGTNSQNTITAANLLNMYHIPMVGAVSTSSILSNKEVFEYFLRVAPSDDYQARAIVDLLLLYDWTYVNVINSAGSYGELGIKEVIRLAEQAGLCIAYSREITAAANDVVFEETIDEMLMSPARVVVMFVQSTHGRQLMAASQRLGLLDYFIWIVSDGMSVSSDTNGIENVADDGFFIDLYSQGQPAFFDYFEDISINNTDNPWVSELWQAEFPCASQPQGCDLNLTMKNITGYQPNNKTSLFIDAVMTYAHGLRALFLDRCPDVFKNVSLLSSCLTHMQLLPYLMGVRFNGTSGIVRFDENGDVDGKYQIDQLQVTHAGGYEVVTIALWDKSVNALQLQAPAFWSHMPLGIIPESVCSYPCGLGEYRVQLELKCCWECRLCHVYEILVQNGTNCAICDLLTWPDEDTLSVCLPIPPTYIDLTRLDSIFCVAFASIIFISCVAIAIFYWVFRETKLIKATSRDLSILSLLGLLLSCSASVALVNKPTEFTCYAGRFGFNLSFAVAYAPLLVKTNRIYRIFDAGRRGVVQAPICISPLSQMGTALFLVTIQAIISGVAVIIRPPHPILEQPILTEKYVELSCYLPLEDLLPPLVYNVLLIAVCSLYAFKARSLPDNFNESRYIFLSVCTTLFLWIAFIPTYFSSFYATRKALMLSILLLLNSAVMLLCMYVTKVYGVIYFKKRQVLDNDRSPVGGPIHSSRLSNLASSDLHATSDSRKTVY